MYRNSVGAHLNADTSEFVGFFFMVLSSLCPTSSNHSLSYIRVISSLLAQTKWIPFKAVTTKFDAVISAVSEAFG